MKIKMLMLSAVVLSLSLIAGCSSKATTATGDKTNANKTETTTEKKPLKGIPADKACAVFEKAGLKGEYKKGESDYTCYATKIAGKEGAQGFLTYMASGDETTVNYMSLGMNNLMEDYENFKGVDRRKLIVAGGGDLAQMIANQPLPKEIEDAIMSSKPGEWKIGEATVSLKKEAEGSLYELRLVFMF